MIDDIFTAELDNILLTGIPQAWWRITGINISYNIDERGISVYSDDILLRRWNIASGGRLYCFFEELDIRWVEQGQREILSYYFSLYFSYRDITIY